MVRGEVVQLQAVVAIPDGSQAGSNVEIQLDVPVSWGRDRKVTVCVKLPSNYADGMLLTVAIPPPPPLARRASKKPPLGYTGSDKEWHALGWEGQDKFKASVQSKKAQQPEPMQDENVDPQVGVHLWTLTVHECFADVVGLQHHCRRQDERSCPTET